MGYNDYVAICDKYKQKIIEIRRDLHKYAEIGWLEFRTTSKIAEMLDNAGIEIYLGTEAVNPKYILGYHKEDRINENISRAINQGALKKYIDRMNGYTGLMAVIDSGKPGPCTALRFDIDALEIDEYKGEDHRPFREGFCSVNANSDHSCGHDGHASIGIITALVLNEIKDKLIGKVKIFFQPAEEGVKGAVAMTNTSNFDDINNLLSGHLGFGSFEKGVLIANTYGFFATTKFDVHYKGVSAHAGASPEKGRNALLAAASAALNIHAQCQDGRGVSRVNVGSLISGTCSNSIADSAEMLLETRGETSAINQDMFNRTIRTINASAAMYDVQVNTDVVGQADCASGDKELVDIIKKVVGECGIMNKIVDTYNMNASEDITCMMKKVQEHGGKACYMMFGTPTTAPHHNTKFDFDESVLLDAVKVYIACISNINN